MLLKCETLSDALEYFGISSLMSVFHQFYLHHKTPIQINQDSYCAKGWKCEQHITFENFKRNLSKFPVNWEK